MSQVHPNTIKQVLFLGIILFIFVVLFREMYFMFSAILGAFTLYVMMRKKMQQIVIRYRCPRPLAAALLMLLSFVAIVLPFAWVVSILVDRLGPIMKDPAMINQYVEKVHLYLLDKTNINIMNPSYASSGLKNLSSYIPKVAGSTMITISNLTILYFLLYFMLVKNEAFERMLKSCVPLKRNNRDELLNALNKLVMSNAVTIPLLALVQGIVATTGYLIFGVPDPVLWGIITGICSVVPFVGTMLAWAPIALYVFATGETNMGLGLMAWGLFVIGSADNVVRFMLQKKLADIHPIITVFGVIIGVNLLGFWGLVFGPLLISIFLLLIKIYNDEFGDTDEEAGVNLVPADIGNKETKD